MDNVIVLADTLPELAKALRIALDRDTEIREEWIDNKLQIIELLVRTRRQFLDNVQFSIWLARNDLDDLSKDDRAAAINLGQHLALARQVLEESNSWSLRIIWTDNQGRYNDTLSVRSVANTQTQETASPDNNNPPPTKPESERLPDLVKKFGEKTGRVIFNHFDRNTRTTQRLCKRLRKAQAAILADFLRRTPGLPMPANSEYRLGLNTLWRDAPKALAEPAYTLNLSESDALMKVVADWPDKIGPLVAEWRASGERDVARWYARKVPPERAAPAVTTVVALPTAMLAGAVTATIAANAEAAARPRTDPSCRPLYEGPIRYHGVDIWPAPNAPYTFAEAWLAMTIWRTIDNALRGSMPSPKTRAAGFMKPFIGCFRNLNASAGAALFNILHAQDHHPDATDPVDNICPPYDSIQ
jgi:hypothetical protein